MKMLSSLLCHILILISRFIWGSDFRVTNNADGGAGSFRQSIIDLNASKNAQPGTVTFDSGLGRIQLFSDLPTIEVEGEFITSTGDSLVIDGGGNQYRIFRTLNKPFKITLFPSSSLTLSGILDSGSLVKLGLGDLILEGSNSYIKGTTIKEGTLQGNTTSLQGDITNDSYLTFDQMSLGAYSGVISGSGILIKKNIGTLILSNTNTYSGGTIVLEGALQGNTTSLQGDIINDALVIFDQVDTGTYNGMITGTGAVIKQNTGTLILNGSNYTGGTTINGGNLTLLSRLHPMGAVAIHAGVFDISSISSTSQTIYNLSGMGGEVVLGSKMLIAGSLDDTMYEGVISGDGSFTKQGSGTLTLSGIHTYTGATTISSGRIALSGNGSLAIDSPVILSGTDSIFDIAEANGARSIGSIDGVEGSQVFLGDNSLTVGDSNQTIYEGVISGTGAFIKQGSGRLILTGPNTYSGGTLVSAGFLQGNTNSLQRNILNNASVVFDQAYTGTYEGILSGTGAVEKRNTGTVVFTGANTYSGGTMVTLGTLALSGSGSILPTGTVIINVGNLDISDITASSQTIGDLIGGGHIFLGEKTLITATENNTSYVGIIKGAGSFSKQGNGTLSLSGANTYSGGTTIHAGTLALSGSGKLSPTGAITIDAGVFDISNSTDSLQNIGDLSGVGGEILLGNKTLVQEAFNHTSYAGVIKGSGAFIKQGLGTLILAGDNTYSGGTTVNEGILQGNTNSLQGNILNNASVVFDQVYTGTYKGILSGTGAVDKRDTGTVVFTGANTYSGGTTIHAGTLALSGSGKLFPTGAITIDAGVFDISNSTDSLQNIGDLSGVGGEILLGNKTLVQEAFNYTSYAGVIKGSGAFIKQGLGTLILTGDNTYSGGTTVNEGILQGNTNSLQGNILNNAQLVFNQKSLGTYRGSIWGSGSLIKEGSGMVTILDDCSCFTGTVSVHEGSLMIKGKMGGELQIFADAMLAGVGSTSNVINYGKVKPGSSIGTLTVNGNYTQAASGELIIEIDELGASSLLQVTGVATLDGVLQVRPEPGIYLQGTTYTFLTAGSVTGQFSSTFSTLALNYTTHYFPTQAQLFILSSFLVLPVRPSGNAGAVADYLLCSPFDDTNSDLSAVVGVLLDLPTKQYIQALNRLTPSQFGAFALNELENNFSIANTFFVNQEAYCYTTSESTNIWINPLGLVYSQKSRLQLSQEAIGFTNHSYGVAMGVDHLFSNDWTLGFGLGYSSSHLRWKNQAGKARADSGYLGPYIGYHSGNFYFDFLILGAGNFYDVDRKIVFPRISRIASSHPTTWDLSEVVLAGFKLEPFYSFFVQPELLLDQLNIFQESFQESGAGSIDLAVKRKYVSFLRSLINLKVAKEWVYYNLCLAPSVNIGWLRTTPLTGRHYTACFRRETLCSPNFSVTSFNEVIDQVLVGAQLLLSSQGGFSLSLGYDGKFGNGSKVHEINMAMSWRF